MFKLFLFCVLTALLAGCGQSGGPDSAPAVTIRLDIDSLSVGQSTLTITLNDTDGKPVTAQKLHIRGDMTHAGMAPEFAETADSENGIYRVPFGWNMSGDWIVTVTATLADSTTVEKQFDLSIGN